MTFDRAARLIAVAAISSACARSPGGRLAPAGTAAIEQARREMSAAYASGDANAFLRHVAPGAQLRIGRETIDLRNAVLAMGGGRRDSLWLAPRDVRACDQGLYETGGQLGVTSPERPLYRYAATWVLDGAGVAQVTAVALVAGESGGSPPGVAGCRASVRDRFEPRRIHVAVLPGTGLAALGPTGDIETAMQGRSLDVRSVQPAEFKPVWHVPALGMARFQLTRAFGVGVMGTIGTASARTSGADTIAALVIGTRLDQKWIAPLLEARFRDLRIGVGPAFLREAWEVSVEELDTAATTPAIIGHIASAANRSSRVGLVGEISLTAPLTTRLFLDIRAYYLSVGKSSSPVAFGFAPVEASAGGGGIGVAFGVAF